METKYLASLGMNLKTSRKKRYSGDDLMAFSLRLGVSRATLQKMEKGELSVTMDKYYRAARLLDLEAPFHELLKCEESLFDD